MSQSLESISASSPDPPGATWPHRSVFLVAGCKHSVQSTLLSSRSVDVSRGLQVLLTALKLLKKQQPWKKKHLHLGLHHPLVQGKATRLDSSIIQIWGETENIHLKRKREKLFFTFFFRLSQVVSKFVFTHQQFMEVAGDVEVGWQ